MKSRRVFVSLIVLSLAGCEIFLVKVGGDGEPCADNGACDKGLVCNFGDCVEPRGEGDECDDSWVRSEDWTSADLDAEWLSSFDVCEDDLCCNDGVCGVTGNMVSQPDSEVSWTRCTEYSVWENCHCQGEIYTWLLGDDYSIWDYEYFCTGDSRLPSRSEYLSLLGNCDSSVMGGGEGFCDSCEESEECSGMFTFLECEADLVMFTGTFEVANDGMMVDRGWFVDLKTGEVTEEYLGWMSLMRGAVLCVEDN